MRNDIIPGLCRPLVMIAALSIPGTAFALGEEIDKALEQCLDSSDGGTASMLGCMATYNEAWDRILNRNYRKSLEQASPEGKQKIRDAQRAWIAYRDKMVEAIFATGEGGSIDRLSASSFFGDETKRQAIRLRNLK